MGVHVHWHDEDRKIIFIHYEGQWSWQAFHEAAETSKRWAEQTPFDRVDVIAFMDSGFIPGSMAGMIDSGNAVRNPAKNLGLIIIVTTSSLIHTLVAVSIKVIPGVRSHYRIACTIQQAENIIRSDRR